MHQDSIIKGINIRSNSFLSKNIQIFVPQNFKLTLQLRLASHKWCPKTYKGRINHIMLLKFMILF